MNRSLLAAVYTRISRDREGTSLGVARQEKLCLEVANRVGAVVAEVFTDNDVSATSARVRPAWRRMLDAIADGQFDIVIALDSDRLLRRPGDLEQLFELCEKHRVRVSYEHGGFDPVTGDGMMEARIRAAVDAEEVAKLKKRVRRKNRELAEAGKVGSRGGDRPFGFLENRVAHHVTEARVLRELADRLEAGDTVRGLCADLDARGVTTTAGNRWHPSALKRLVTSARVAGQREHEGAFYKGEWEPIIPLDQLVRLRALLRDPSRLTRRHVGKYLLTGGIAVCGRCNAALVARPNDHGQRRYACAKGAGFKGCGRLFRLAEPVERLLVEAIFAVVDDQKFATRLWARTPDANQERETVEQIDAKLASLAERWALDEITESEWAAARDALHSRLEVAQQALQNRSATRAVEQFLGRAGLLRTAWPTLSHDRRRAVVSTLLERVTILPNPMPGRNVFDPSLIVPSWRY